MRFGPVTAVVLVLAGWGAVPAQAQLGTSKQQIAIKMTDNAFSQKALRIKKGTQVTFTFSNKGKLLHEAVVGTKAEQAAHEKEMTDSMDDMSMGDEPNTVSVKAGAQKTLKYTFSKAGTYEISCHEPGHYKAGMKIAVSVS
jgi:uncharacterized cupredoxin-like copper-binding protein